MPPPQEFPYHDSTPNLFSGFELSSGLCHECLLFVQSLLPSDEQKFTSRWSIMNRHQSMQHPLLFRVWTYNSHLNGQRDSLEKSAANGCELCCLFLSTWEQVCLHGSTAQSYQICARDGSFFKFYMCFCEPSSLSYGDLEGLRLQSLEVRKLHVFRRNGSESDFRFFRALSGGKREVFPELKHVDVEANLHCDSEEAIDRARSWFRDCKEKHSNCRRLPAPLPKRVLDLAQAASLNHVYLSETNGAVSEYATLSYSWGKSLPLTTITSNIEQHRNGIPLKKIPRTLRDAVRITRLLGIRYLWIDALCIVQDDKADWATQAALMTDIYEGSSICISALSAEDCNIGFTNLANAHARIGILRCPTNRSEFVGIFIGRDNSIAYGEAHEVIDDGYLNTRGWTFQERLVSVASLHYTNQGMVWECADAEIIETKPWTLQWSGATLKKQWAKLRLGGPQGPRRDSSDATEPTAIKQEHLSSWYDFIEEYTARNLTKDTDKFPAIAGVARAVQQQTSMRYLVGLWDQDLLSGLSWSRKEATETLRLAAQYRAPSWSWASVDGQIRYKLRFVGYKTPKFDLQIHDCNLEEAQKGSFGQILTASLRVTGLMQSARLEVHVFTPASTATIVDGIIPGVLAECILDRPREWPTGVYDCFCLRLGVNSDGGRDSVAWLIISPTDARESEYRRIGIGNTIAWGPSEARAIDFDVFVAGKRTELTLV